METHTLRPLPRTYTLDCVSNDYSGLAMNPRLIQNRMSGRCLTSGLNQQIVCTEASTLYYFIPSFNTVRISPYGVSSSSDFWIQTAITELHHAMYAVLRSQGRQAIFLVVAVFLLDEHRPHHQVISPVF